MEDNIVHGVISGFDEITADDKVNISSDFPEVKDLSDVLDLIKQLQTASNTAAPLRKLFQEHINDINNPHKIDISLTSVDFINTLYNLYCSRFGETISVEDFTIALVDAKRFATVNDVLNKVNLNSLVSASTMQFLVEEHNVDPNAHDNLLRHYAPGTPILIPPYEIFNPHTIPEANSYVVSRNSIMNTHDINGMIVANAANTFAEDYSYGIPTTPIFKQHQNIILQSESLFYSTLVNVAKNSPPSNLLLLSPNNNTNYLLLKETSTSGKHGIRSTILNILSSFNTDTFYYYPFKRTKLLIQFIDGSSNLLTSFVINCQDMTTQEITSSGYTVKNHVELIKLPNGWYRISVSFDAASLNIKYIDVNFYDLSDNTTYSGDVNSIAGIFWQHQLTNTSMPAPPIFTTDAIVTVDNTKITKTIPSFNPLQGAISLNYLASDLGKFNVTRSLLRLGNNTANRTAVTIDTHPTDSYKFRINSYSNSNTLIASCDSLTFNTSNDVVNEYDTTFTYSIESMGFGYDKQVPITFALDHTVIPLSIYNYTNINSTGLKLDDTQQIPNTHNTYYDNPDNRLYSLVNTIELGFNSLTNQYLNGYLIGFKMYNFTLTMMQLEFLMNQYIEQES